MSNQVARLHVLVAHRIGLVLCSTIVFTAGCTSNNSVCIGDLKPFNTAVLENGEKLSTYMTVLDHNVCDGMYNILDSSMPADAKTLCANALSGLQSLDGEIQKLHDEIMDLKIAFNCKDKKESDRGLAFLRLEASKLNLKVIRATNAQDEEKLDDLRLSR